MKKLDLKYFMAHPKAANAMRPSPFDNTPYAAWAGIAGSTKGSIAEHVTKDYMKEAGIKVESRTNTDHDTILNSIKTEIKFSTLNRDNGFIWNQLKLDGDWEKCLFFALEPNQLKVYWCSKEEVNQYAKDNDLKGQHNKNREVMITHERNDIPSIFKELNLKKSGLFGSSKITKK